MIIACSNNALKHIKGAFYRRIAKNDGRPIVLEDKRKLQHARAALEKAEGASALIWNLDLTEAPVTHGGETVGTVITGYLFQRESKLTVVLNSLDDADLCRIGETARSAITAAFDDCHINRHVSAAHLAAADKLGVKIARACDVNSRFLPYGTNDGTLLIPNSDRKAASGLTQARSTHEDRMFHSGGASISSEAVDRTACYELNNRPMDYTPLDGSSGKRSSTPGREMRRMANDRWGFEHVYAVDVEVELMEDLFNLRNSRQVAPRDERGRLTRISDFPECRRTLRVPIDAQLSWVHLAIQKAFNWYDYHLHRFNLLDYEARELLGRILEVEFDVRDYLDDEPLADKRERYGEDEVLARFEEITGLGKQWLYRHFEPYARREIIEQDFPQAELPEDAPIGLHLFGEKNYRILTENAPNPSANMVVADIGPTNELYYNYDFGDDWDLAITPKRLVCVPAGQVPAVLDGVGHTPAEDCGGIGGYVRLVDAYELTNPNTRDAARLELRSKFDEQLPAANGPKEEALRDDEIDAMVAEALEDAEKTMDWARYRVGWRPFDAKRSIEDAFDNPGWMH